MRPIFGMVIIAVMAATLQAVPINPYGVDYATQDPILIDENLAWHELGDFFPPNELIESSWAETTYQPCPENPDNSQVPNILVTMTNLSRIDWYNVHYVADSETFLQNDDGLIGNAGLLDAQLAFRIDNLGVNTPLVYESISVDNIFQAGETWEFVIQDFVNSLGVAAAPFASIGIASLSDVVRDPNSMSSGSIIASQIPEPATLAVWSLLGACGAAAAARRRKRT
jgi:hypothetical protein